MALSIGKLMLVLALLAMALAQQICLKQECVQQLAACNDECVTAMGKCMFSCTMGSLGCLQKCLGNSAPAQDLLECAFNKCINL
jgi:hypothetical protein